MTFFLSMLLNILTTHIYFHVGEHLHLIILIIFSIDIYFSNEYFYSEFHHLIFLYSLYLFIFQSIEILNFLL